MSVQQPPVWMPRLYYVTLGFSYTNTIWLPKSWACKFWFRQKEPLLENDIEDSDNTLKLKERISGNLCRAHLDNILFNCKLCVVLNYKELTISKSYPNNPPKNDFEELSFFSASATSSWAFRSFSDAIVFKRPGGVQVHCKGTLRSDHQNQFDFCSATDCN